MIEAIEFKNFRALRNATLPLGRCTLIVGPNGSGKSTAIQGLTAVAVAGANMSYERVVSAGANSAEVVVTVCWGDRPARGATTKVLWDAKGTSLATHRYPGTGELRAGPNVAPALADELRGLRVYSLDARIIGAPVQLQPHAELSEHGGNLSVVLTHLQDQEPERFEALNAELGQWLPEFDRVLFTTPGPGQRGFALRTRIGRHVIGASDLSQGVVLALCMLTMAYLPHPPTILCLEEPDRGIHPRLLREVRDALYRLAYPESVGEKRDPVQVIVTTHSPYLLDLFRDHPEEIVLADKLDGNVRFQRLSDIPHVEEILQDAQLSDVWYTGVLGGVPTGP